MRWFLQCFVMLGPRGGGYSHTLPIRVCAAQRGRDFEASDLERGIHVLLSSDKGPDCPLLLSHA